MAAIVIFATSNSKQTGINITDQTDWGNIGGSLSSLTDVTIELYSSGNTPAYTPYILSPLELDDFISNGTIELSFLTIAGATYINDGWWLCRVTANAGSYISNYSGFGIYADITFAVFNEINSLHVPEEIKYNAERYCTLAMWLDGLRYLDTTNINSRGEKFTKRIRSLQKMLLNI